MRLQGTMNINGNGHLEIGGCDAVELANKYGTPLYVMDIKLVKERCKAFSQAFTSKSFETEVLYAGKAFLTLAMCQIIDQMGLSLDVVSGGELFTAIRANFPASRIYFHGNNKTTDELIMALQYGVNKIIADNVDELRLLEKLCTEMDKPVEVLLRINPGIEAHTHEYIQTATQDSKFGISAMADNICDIVSSVRDSYYLKIKGFHYHIGSQIMEVSSFVKAADHMTDFLYKVKTVCGFEAEELNLGGGFGVYYSEVDQPPCIHETLTEIMESMEGFIYLKGLKKPKLLIEPGRAIVGNAGTTLYKVGSMKETINGKQYIFVDGGMSDNPRTALYDAVYEAAIANKMTEPCETTYTVAGKCCESGDVLIHSVDLPLTMRDDILAISTTGAYNYSMASNYNRLRKPAVVFVENGNNKVVVKRESYEDLLKNDMMY